MCLFFERLFAIVGNCLQLLAIVGNGWEELSTMATTTTTTTTTVTKTTGLERGNKLFADKF